MFISGTCFADSVVLSYNKHVKTIFRKNCGECHNGKTSGLPNWLDYKTVYNNRSLIRDKLTEKQMPPSSVGPFGMNEHERLILVKWIDTGAKE
jgi:uncharacterized membrane protein